MNLDIAAGPHTPTLKPLTAMPLARKRAIPFNATSLLTGTGDGNTTLQCRKQQILFTQGDAANAVFYIVKGWVKLTVVSKQGKEAVVAMLEGGDFFGEACLAGQRVCSATAISLDA